MDQGTEERENPVDEIFCEDCLVGMDRIRDKSIDMVLCDLPYGITNCEWDSVLPVDKLWRGYNRIIKDNGAIVLFASAKFAALLINSQSKLFRYDLIWDKGRGSDFLNANKKPLNSHENILVFYKKQPTYNKQVWYAEPYEQFNAHRKPSSPYNQFERAYTKSTNGERNPLSVLRFPKDGGRGGRLHPTQKPVSLLEWLIKTYTNRGEIVLDNAFGSGSTLVAAKQAGRHYIGFETSSEYYEIAKSRLEDCREREW